MSENPDFIVLTEDDVAQLCENGSSELILVIIGQLVYDVSSYSKRSV